MTLRWKRFHGNTSTTTLHIAKTKVIPMKHLACLPLFALLPQGCSETSTPAESTSAEPDSRDVAALKPELLDQSGWSFVGDRPS